MHHSFELGKLALFASDVSHTGLRSCPHLLEYLRTSQHSVHCIHRGFGTLNLGLTGSLSVPLAAQTCSSTAQRNATQKRQSTLLAHTVFKMTRRMGREGLAKRAVMADVVVVDLK